jgi:WbqC-like protein family
VSGPLARNYLDVELFERADVEVVWFDYSGYAPYAQPHGPFEHHLSVVDLLFCEGDDSRRFLKTTAVEPAEAR